MIHSVNDPPSACHVGCLASSRNSDGLFSWAAYVRPVGVSERSKTKTQERSLLPGLWSSFWIWMESSTRCGTDCQYFNTCLLLSSFERLHQSNSLVRLLPVRLFGKKRPTEYWGLTLRYGWLSACQVSKFTRLAVP